MRSGQRQRWAFRWRRSKPDVSLGRNFRILFYADSVSQLGDALSFIARSWLAVTASDSPLFLSLVFVAASLPDALTAMAVAHFADKRREMRVMIVACAYAVRAPMSFALGLIALDADFSPGLFLLCVGLLAMGRGAGNPSAQALVPEIVPDAQLERAIGSLGAIYRASQALGPALGGALVSVIGLPALFFADALSFLAAAVLASRIRPQFDSTAQQTIITCDLGSYLLERPRLSGLLLASVAMQFVLAPLYIVFILLVRGTLSDSPILLGAALTSFAIGYGVGALLFAAHMQQSSLRMRILAPGLLCGSAVALAGSSAPSIMLLALAVAGAGFAVNMVTIDSCVQRLSDNEVRARVQAVRNSLLALGVPIAYLIVGVLDAWFPPSLVIAMLGLAYAAIVVAAAAVAGGV